VIGASVDALAIWRDYAADVREVVFDCGHFIAEEEPDACARGNRLKVRVRFR
jgi:haloacetate dehalogenase